MYDMPPKMPPHIIVEKYILTANECPLYTESGRSTVVILRCYVISLLYNLYKQEPF